MNSPTVTKDLDPIMREMLEAAMHFGHKTQKWNPNIKHYLYGSKNGIHIFDLKKTAEAFLRALNFLSQSIAEGKTVLIVSTKQQSKPALNNLVEQCDLPHVSERWIPGLLTNFTTIKKRIKVLTDLKKQRETGELQKYTKKEIQGLEKKIDKLESALGGIQHIKKVPDVVFILDIVRDRIALLEAKKLGLPIVAVVDTNANPNEVDYPIPGNDDAIKSINYIFEKIRKSIQSTPKNGPKNPSKS